MLARIRKSTQEKDQGFTLIELLVVMIIIGILAAIAIPVFTSQRAKAVDTAARSDVSVLGKEVATWTVGQPATTGVPAFSIVGSNYSFATTPVTTLGRASTGVTAPALKSGSTAAAWCVQVTVAGGTNTNQHYSSTTGLAEGVCP